MPVTGSSSALFGSIFAPPTRGKAGVERPGGKGGMYLARPLRLHRCQRLPSSVTYRSSHGCQMPPWVRMRSTAPRAQAVSIRSSTSWGNRPGSSESSAFLAERSRSAPSMATWALMVPVRSRVRPKLLVRPNSRVAENSRRSCAMAVSLAGGLSRSQNGLNSSSRAVRLGASSR